MKKIFLADSESTETLEPLFIPEIPNKIIWIQSMKPGVLWLSLGGYDAGYIYEYLINQKSDIPQRFRMVYDADDTEISSYIYKLVVLDYQLEIFWLTLLRRKT